MTLNRYSNYKESGVNWLGEVPDGWCVQKLKYACEVFPSNVDKHSREDEPVVKLCNYTDVYYNEVISADMPFMVATASVEQVAKFTLRAGDTIITKDSESADDIAIAAYVPQDLPGVICGYHLSMVRPKPATCGAFVKRLFDSMYAKARFEVAANGLTRVGLGQYALDNVEFPFPPHEEQLQIAAFLDHETAKIDALVAEQQRLIELLQEKRQAVISHAVTKGLDPMVPMTDSGVEWLGKVPEHWKVLPLRRSIEFLTDYEANGSFADTKANVVIDEGEPHAWYVRTTDLEQRRTGLVEGNRFCNEKSYNWLQKTALFGGELLVAKRGEIGKVYVMPEANCKATLAPNLYLIRLNPRLQPKYAWFWFSVDPGRAELILADKSTTIGAFVQRRYAFNVDCRSSIS